MRRPLAPSTSLTAVSAATTPSSPGLNSATSKLSVDRADSRLASVRFASVPPLRLAVPAVAAAWALVFEVARFVGLVNHDSAANDFRLVYVAAEAGVQVGWARMYDPLWLQQFSFA